MASVIRVEELGDTVRGGGGIREHGLERKGGGDKRKVGRRRGRRRRFKRGSYHPPTAEIRAGGELGGVDAAPGTLNEMRVGKCII